MRRGPDAYEGGDFCGFGFGFPTCSFLGLGVLGELCLSLGCGLFFLLLFLSDTLELFVSFSFLFPGLDLEGFLFFLAELLLGKRYVVGDVVCVVGVEVVCIS